MPYLLPEQKLAVFFSPKVAGTSLRAFLFEIENGFKLREYRVQGVLHDLVGLASGLMTNDRFSVLTLEDYADAERIALVRDPVRRAISAYSNRVIFYGELSEAAEGPRLQEAGLTPDPDIDLFFANFLAYRRCSRPIERHFRHQDRFLGKDAAYYSRVFQVEALQELVDYVNEKCGTAAEMPRLQDGGPKIEFDGLSEETKKRIVDIVAPCSVFEWVPHYKEKYADYLA